MVKCYYLGGMTPNGFSTKLSKLVDNTDYFTYILKGGPGTGKSSIMKKIAGKCESSQDVTMYYCSSDPDSLDAIVLNASKVIIVDGTPPHIFEPLFPGVCQKIINLGECWDESLLKEKRKEIIDAIRQNKSLMKKAAENSNTLGEVCERRIKKAEEFVNMANISAFAKDFCNEHFKKSCEGKGNLYIRQLSVMTRYGYSTRLETLKNYEDLYVLKDNWFASADILIKLIATFAVEKGYDVRLSNCLLFGTTVREHLLIDELNMALISLNPLTQLTCHDKKQIDCSDFYDEKSIKEYDEFWMDNEKQINELSDRSSQLLTEAKAAHDEIEKYYIQAMDFTALNRISDKLIANLTQTEGKQI